MIACTSILWVIDDNPADQQLTRIAFRDYLDLENIISFYSAEAAIEALAQGASPSLVLLDLNMPGLGGKHFLTQRQQHSYLHIPVVILSSSTNPDDITSTYALGANSYLSKPSDLNELREFAHSVHEYWFKLAQLPGAVR